MVRLYPAPCQRPGLRSREGTAGAGGSKGDEHMKRSLAVAALLVAAFLGSGALLAAQAAPAKASCCADKSGTRKHACSDKQGCADKDGCCRDHRGMNPEMAAKMTEMDKHMDELAAKMNTAKGDEKVDAMAALLNEMLARHKTMGDRMRAHHEGMCGEAAAGEGKKEEKSEGLLGEPGQSR